ncbi:MAG: IS200/IS605 family transposase [Candidatus Symbiothrix sp.]|jgi:REP element-mobilizing transposase RayT|nr:IS200/IS605 family transposase [Candidatus Symbiothrix sp.]
MPKPNVYTQIYIQLVFSPKNRNALLHKEIRPTVFSYISGIVDKMAHKSIAVNGMADHVHILFGLDPKISISDTVRDIKRSSSLFINSNHLCRYKFEWQEGYGGFSYGRSNLNKVYKYVLNQEKHHQKMTFKTEYTGFLDRFEVPYEDPYLFQFFD